MQLLPRLGRRAKSVNRFEAPGHPVARIGDRRRFCMPIQYPPQVHSPLLRGAADVFGRLNPEQREAVEHASGGGAARPLLVIAGAGTGKTMTLAARVARLVLDGADPQRILLLTFSRRAALEMQRRVGRTLHDALGLRATRAVPSLPWAGTFHSVGARLLRELATSVGLSE